MRRTIAAAALAALVLAAGMAAAQTKVGDIEIEHPWARATAGGARVGAAYMIIRNEGQTADRLVGAETGIAEAAELHSQSMDSKGVMRMRPLSSVAVPAGGTVELAPGGMHVMLPGLKAPLEKGQHFPLTLRFEKAGEVEVEVPVLGVTATGSGHGHGH